MQPSQDQIDDIVAAHADDATAWEDPIHIERMPGTVALSGELLARVAFFARLHGVADVDEWVAQIIQERLGLEQAIYVGMKRTGAQKENGRK